MKRQLALFLPHSVPLSPLSLSLSLPVSLSLSLCLTLSLSSFLSLTLFIFSSLAQGFFWRKRRWFEFSVLLLIIQIATAISSAVKSLLLLRPANGGSVSIYWQQLKFYFLILIIFVTHFAFIFLISAVDVWILHRTCSLAGMKNLIVLSSSWCLDNNNNDIKRRNLRYFAISSLSFKPSATYTFKWPRCSCVQNTCSTLVACHVQYIVCHVVQKDSSAIKFDRVEITFILALFRWLKQWRRRGNQSNQRTPSKMLQPSE